MDGRRLKKLVLGVAILIAASVLAWRLYYPAIEAAYRDLAQRFSRTELRDQDQIGGIIVLGGTPGRIEEASDVAARFPGAPVIVSGAGEEAAGRAMAAFAGRMMLDRRPKNTFENAFFSKELANPRPGQRWILVTSAVHMPRAMGAFRGGGFAVEPWPVHENPSREQQAILVFHEIAGLFLYRILGRSQAFYPGQ